MPTLSELLNQNPFPESQSLSDEDAIAYYLNSADQTVGIKPTEFIKTRHDGTAISIPENNNSQVYLPENFTTKEDAIQAAIDNTNNNGGGIVHLSEDILPFDESSITVPSGVFLTRPDYPKLLEVDTITTLRSLDTSVASTVYVREPIRKSGKFVSRNSDPFGRGDDGINVLQGPDGNWWIREKKLELEEERAGQQIVLDVPGDFSTIQSAIDAVPKILRRQYVIQVANGTYGERVVLRGFKTEATTTSSLGDDSEGENNLFVIKGDPSNPSNVKTGSFLCIGCLGSAAPSIKGFDLRSSTSFQSGRNRTDEDASIGFYGGGQGKVVKCNFGDSGRKFGIIVYSASVKARSNTFNGQDVGIHLKRGSWAIAAENGGSCGVKFASSRQGGFLVYNTGGDHSVTAPNRTFLSDGIAINLNEGGSVIPGGEGQYPSTRGYVKTIDFTNIDKWQQGVSSNAFDPSYKSQRGFLEINTGSTQGESVRVRKNILNSGGGLFTFNNQWRVRFNFQPMTAIEHIRLSLGIFNQKSVGLEIKNGDIFGHVQDTNGFTQEKLLSNIGTGSGNDLSITIAHQPFGPGKVSFRSGQKSNNLLAKVTQNVPSGDFLFDNLIDIEVANPNDASESRLKVGLIKVEQWGFRG